MSIELYNADCLDVMRCMPDNSVDLIVADPPYHITNISGGGTVNNVKKLNESLQGLKSTVDMTQGYDIEFFGNEFLRVLKEPNLYFWCNKRQILDYLNFYAGKHKCKFDILFWAKTNALPTYSNKYLSDTEYCLYFRKGKGKCFPKSYEDAKTYYISPINHKDKKLYGHPTVKPLDFTEKLIRNSSCEGQRVFDPFMGSGTTGVACVKLKRDFIGVEISNDYFKIAEQRVKEAE